MHLEPIYVIISIGGSQRCDLNSLKLIKVIIILLCLGLLFSKSAVAASDVIINEVAWMGTQASPFDEWVEFYNTSGKEINLSSWGLYAGGTLILKLNGIISPKSYYLIERGSDEVISDIKASETPIKWAKGLLNSGEYLELRKSDGSVEDFVDCEEKWCSGNSKGRISMERGSDGWYTSTGSIGLDREGNKIYGTPKSKNSLEISDNGGDKTKDITVDFDLKKVEGGNFELSLSVDGSDKERNYKFKLVAPALVYLEKENKWVYYTASWNSQPDFREGRRYKVRPFFLETFNAKIQVRDSTTLKIYESEEKKVEVQKIFEGELNESPSYDFEYRLTHILVKESTPSLNIYRAANPEVYDTQDESAGVEPKITQKGIAVDWDKWILVSVSVISSILIILLKFSGGLFHKN